MANPCDTGMCNPEHCTDPECNKTNIQLFPVGGKKKMSTKEWRVVSLELTDGSIVFNVKNDEVTLAAQDKEAAEEIAALLNKKCLGTM